MKIPIARPYFGDEEGRAAAEAVSSGWVSQGPKVAELEKVLAKYIGVKHVVLLNSCTAALHLSLITAGVGPGDEVIVPAFTFVATANACEYVGARPVMADIELATFNIDPALIEEKLTGRTKAVIAVHLFGLTADMDPINEIAARHGLTVIEDAACAMGAAYRGRSAGTLGAAAAFSLHPRKAITTGEGGFVATDDDEIARFSGILRNHAAEVSDFARHQGGGALLPAYRHVGYNYRMTDIQAAVGLVQMKKRGEIFGERKKQAAEYNRLLGDIDWLDTVHVPRRMRHGYQSYVTAVKPEALGLEGVEAGGRFRDALMAELERMGVATRQGTHALHVQEYYAVKYGLSPGDYPQALAADRLSMAIPIFAGLTGEELAYVVESIKAAGEKLRGRRGGR